MNTHNLLFDVAISGAGAAGSAIGRELARYNINVVLLEANPDAGMGTSKASTAIWHTGFDAKPDSLEATLMHRNQGSSRLRNHGLGCPGGSKRGFCIKSNSGVSRPTHP